MGSGFGRRFASLGRGVWRLFAGVVFLLALAAEGDDGYSPPIFDGGGEGGEFVAAGFAGFPPPAPPNKLEGGLIGRGFWGEVAGRVRAGALAPELVDEGDVRDWLLGVGNGRDVDFGEWRRARGLRVLSGYERVFSSAVSGAAVSRFGFVKRARVDFQTPLGGRPGQAGVEALGGLRESGEDVLGWELRAFAAEGGEAGANAGIFYRWLAADEGGLFGGNVFLDFHDDDEGGGFFRWSFGGEYKSRLGGAHFNRYIPLTEGKERGGVFIYTRGGYDADVFVRVPRLEWLALRLGWQRWEGERGDADDEGLRYGLRARPGGGWEIGLEFDEDSGKAGGNISYSHMFNEPLRSAEGAASGFDARAHYYDSVRREHAQRISRAGGGASRLIAVLVSSNLTVDIGIGTITATMIAGTTAQINYSFPLTSDVNITTGTTPANGNAFLRQQAGGWNLTLNSSSTVAILQTARLLSVGGGGGEFERFGGDPLATVIMPGVTLALLGTRLEWQIESGTARVTLREGGVALSELHSTVTMDIVAGARAIVGGQTVGCGAGQTAKIDSAVAHCALANARRELPVADGAATVRTGDSLPAVVGSVVLAGDGGVSAAVSPSDVFDIVTVRNTVFIIRMTTTAAFGDIAAVVAAAPGNDLQTARVFVFPVRFSPPGLVIGFAGSPNFAPVTAAGAATVGVVTVGGGENPGNPEFVNGAANGFAFINNSVLVVADARATVAYTVTIRASDVNADVGDVSLTVSATVFGRPGFAQFLPLTFTAAITVAAGDIVTVLAAGGEGALSHSAVGVLPAWVNYNNVNGVFSFVAGQVLPAAGDVTIIVAASDSATPPERATTTVTFAFVNPPDITLRFLSAPDLGRLTTADDVIAGTLEISGGRDGVAPTYTADGNRGTWNINADDAVVLSGAETETAQTLTATVTADDDHSGSAAGMLTLMLTLFNDLVLPPPSGDVLTVTTRTDYPLLADFDADNGAGILYGLLNNASPAFAVDADDGELRFSGNPISPVAVLTATVAAGGRNLAGGESAATAFLTLEIVDPPTLSLGFVGDANLSQLTTDSAVTAGTLLLSGGAAEGTRTTAIVGDVNGFSLGGGSVLIREGGNENMLTVTVFVRGDDSHDNTTPITATVVFALIAGVNLPSPPDVVTVTTRVAAGAAIVTLTAVGGGDTPNYSYGLLAETDITVAIGEDDGKLTLSSPPHLPITATITAIVSGVNAASETQSATAAITLIANDPPPLTAGFMGTPRFSLIGGGDNALFTATAGGGYGNYRFTLETNSPVVAGLNLPVFGLFNQGAPFGDRTSYTISASVIVADEHANTGNSVLLVTVRFFADVSLTVAPAAALNAAHTVFTRGVGNIAGGLRFIGVNGSGFNYGYVGSSPQGVALRIGSSGGVPSWIFSPSAPATGALTVRAVGTNLAGGSSSVTVTVTVAIVVPPALTLEFAGAAEFVLLTADGAATVGTINVSGGSAQRQAEFADSENINGFTLIGGSVLAIADARAIAEYTVTLAARDSHRDVDDVFLTVAVTVANELLFRSPAAVFTLIGSITARASVLATISSSGGAGVKTRAVIDSPDWVSYDANNGEFGLVAGEELPAGGTDVTVLLTASDSSAPPIVATATVSLVFVNPPALTVDAGNAAADAAVGSEFVLLPLASFSGGWLDPGGNGRYSVGLGFSGGAAGGQESITHLPGGRQTWRFSTRADAAGFATIAVTVADDHRATEDEIFTLRFSVVAPLTLDFAWRTPMATVVLTGGAVLIATVSLLGGRNQTLEYLSGPNTVGLTVAGGVTLLTADVREELTATVVLRARDDDAAIADYLHTLHLQFFDGVVLNAFFAATITTYILEPLATLEAGGGTAPLRLSLLNATAQVSLNNMTVDITGTLEAEGEIIITAEVSDSTQPNALRATAEITVRIEEPRTVSVGAVTATNAFVTGTVLVLATVSAAGGYLAHGGDYRYSVTVVGPAGTAFANAEGIVSVSMGATGILTLLITAHPDEHPQAPPRGVTVTALADEGILSLFFVTIAHPTATQAAALDKFFGTITAQGGIRPYSFTVVGQAASPTLTASPAQSPTAGRLRLQAGRFNVPNKSLDSDLTRAPGTISYVLTLRATDPFNHLDASGRRADVVVTVSMRAVATLGMAVSNFEQYWYEERAAREARFTLFRLSAYLGVSPFTYNLNNSREIQDPPVVIAINRNQGGVTFNDSVGGGAEYLLQQRVGSGSHRVQVDTGRRRTYIVASADDSSADYAPGRVSFDAFWVSRFPQAPGVTEFSGRSSGLILLGPSYCGAIDPLRRQGEAHPAQYFDAQHEHYQASDDCRGQGNRTQLRLRLVAKRAAQEIRGQELQATLIFRSVEGVARDGFRRIPQSAPPLGQTIAMAVFTVRIANAFTITAPATRVSAVFSVLSTVMLGGVFGTVARISVGGGSPRGPGEGYAVLASSRAGAFSNGEAGASVTLSAMRELEFRAPDFDFDSGAHTATIIAFDGLDSNTVTFFITVSVLQQCAFYANNGGCPFFDWDGLSLTVQSQSHGSEMGTSLRMRQMLQAGLDPNEPISGSLNPLLFSAIRGHRLDLAQLLREFFADNDLREGNNTPLDIVNIQNALGGGAATGMHSLLKDGNMPGGESRCWSYCRNGDLRIGNGAFRCTRNTTSAVQCL